jgi:hypothetical protein
MRCLYIAVTAILCNFSPVLGGECPFPESSFPNISVAVHLEFIKTRIANSDFTCANILTKELATRLESLPGIEGIDARYALREWALGIAQDTLYPYESSLALLRSVALSLEEEGQNIAKEEIQADVAMFLAAARHFHEQKETAASLDALILAIQVDLRLEDANRRVTQFSGIDNFIPDNYEHKSIPYIDRLAKLAEITQGDTKLEMFRHRLAWNAYYAYNSFWIKKGSHFTNDVDNREVVLERCRQLLRLVNALDDVTSYKGYVG